MWKTFFKIKQKKTSRGNPAAQERQAAHLIAAANAYRDRQDFENAAEGYLKALSISNNPDIWVQYGNMRKDAGSFTEAITGYMSALTLWSHGSDPVPRPKCADALSQIGHTYRKASIYSAAAEMFRMAHQMQPDPIYWKYYSSSLTTRSSAVKDPEIPMPWDLRFSSSLIPEPSLLSVSLLLRGILGKDFWPKERGSSRKNPMDEGTFDELYNDVVTQLSSIKASNDKIYKSLNNPFGRGDANRIGGPFVAPNSDYLMNDNKIRMWGDVDVDIEAAILGLRMKSEVRFENEVFSEDTD